MALSDRIESLQVKEVIKTQCPVTILLESMATEDKKAFAEALASPISNVSLTAALRLENYKIAEMSISNHRKGLCRCQTNN
jgi:hypothetical protein